MLKAPKKRQKALFKPGPMRAHAAAQASREDQKFDFSHHVGSENWGKINRAGTESGSVRAGLGARSSCAVPLGGEAAQATAPAPL
jgi:hypothetical protein